MATLEDTQGKAFDFAQDAAKQLITLSTGIVTITLTFFKDFTNGATPLARDLMPWSWGLFVVSVLAGIATLLALTGTLGGGGTNVYAGSAGLFVGAQQILFVVALVIAVVAGVDALSSDATTPTPTPRPT